MNYNIIKESITGIKNRARGKDSQDFYRYIIKDDYYIMVVADGHSTDFFKWSKQGAVIACEVLIEVFEKYRDNIDDNIDKIKQEIYDEWMEKVAVHFYKNNYKALRVQYLKYSTTLLGVLITNNFMFSIKVGDGNIVVKQDDVYSTVFKSKYKRIVDSLGRKNSKDFIRYSIYNINENPITYVSIFTDGYENSFKKFDKLYKDLEDFYIEYNKSVFSRYNLQNNYRLKLINLSKHNGNDDVSIMHMMKQI